MSATLRDVLAQRVNDAGTPDLDLDELVALGEHRLRRRRVAAVVGAASAVVVVVAVAVGVGLNGPAQDRGGPVDHPTSPARKLVYSDILWTSDGVIGRTVHLGDRLVETGSGFVHLDVTDDGFLYTIRGGAWFSDGGTPEQVGSHLCSADQNGRFSHFDDRAVMSANTGSLAAWFDCTEAKRPALVVYDTVSRREVARRQIAFCGPGLALTDSCELYGLTHGQVYLNQGVYRGFPRPEYKFDVTTGRLSATTQQDYAEDVRSHPRGLVLGDSWQTGAPTNAVGQRFAMAGSRLVPINDHDQATSAFDTATRLALRLRLPSEYKVEPGATFTLFEWLDDGTVALADSATGDILTCQLSNGRCVVAVRAPQGGDRGEAHRIFPNFPLPG